MRRIFAKSFPAASRAFLAVDIGGTKLAVGIVTEDGDEFEIEAPAFGAVLRNRLKAVKPRFKPDAVKVL